ncbi:MAG: hypothetical protein ACYTGK_18255 [Planctomycetota bacterium]|jgi:hypothetical protein
MRYGVFLLVLSAWVGAQDTGLTGVLDEEAFKKLHDLSKEKRPPPAGKMIQLKRSKAYLSLPKTGSPRTATPRWAWTSTKARSPRRVTTR